MVVYQGLAMNQQALIVAKQKQNTQHRQKTEQLGEKRSPMAVATTRAGHSAKHGPTVVGFAPASSIFQLRCVLVLCSVRGFCLCWVIVGFS